MQSSVKLRTQQGSTLRIQAAFTVVVTAIVFCTVASLPIYGQVAGATLSGTIVDQSGAVVPKATISIKNVDTGVVRQVSSNTDGFYTAPNLLPGNYDVEIAGSGFSTAVNKGIVLTVGARQTLNQTLHLGNVKDTVEVTGAAPTVQLSSSTISGVVDSTTMRELPLNGRDWTSLATLEPGVVSIPNQVSTAFNANKGNRGFGNQLSNGGHRANENTYRVNGISINDYSNGAPGGATGLNLGVDGIQEFSVLTSDYTAEYGRTSGAVINAITKSGVNAVHGTGFFFDRDKVFDARNYFDGPTIPPFRRIQFGGSAGGALVKDRTFIYGSYEGVRQNQPLSALIRVPSAATRALAVPAIQPYLALWPNAPAGTPVNSAGIQAFPVAIAGIASENYFTARVDQKLSNADNLNGSYFWDSGPQSQADPLQNTIHQVFSRRQAATVEETHVFGSQFVNTFRGGVSRVRGDINAPVSGNSVSTNKALATAPGAAATPQIAVTGLTTAIGLGGLNQFFHRWTSIQVNDDAFVTRGTHSIKLGFAFERMQYNILEKLSPNGRVKYSSLANFLNNRPVTLNALAPGQSHEVGIRESIFAGYIQDDWRFRPSLTLNLGLRYEFSTLPTEAHNQIQEITTLSNCTASPTACTAVPVHSFIAQNPTTANLEPRIGFAWDPFRNGKTAVHGGFGMFDVLPLPYEFGLNTSATAPFQIVGADPAATLGSGIDNNISFNPSRVRNRFVQQDPKRALVMNWNFNIQQEIAKSWTVLVGYVGSRSVHLSVAADDINLIQPTLTSAGYLWPCDPSTIPTTGYCTQGRGTRIDPNAGGGAGIRPVLFDGASTYHGLQTQLKKNISYGLQGQLSYTFGKCRDTSSAPVTGDTYVNSIAVPLLFTKNYRIGGCDFDIRHTMVGTLLWEVPGAKSATGFLSYLANGWQLGTIVNASSGSPFTAMLGADGDPLGTGYNGDFSMAVPTLVRGCNPIHGGVNYLNVNCFALPVAPPGFAGVCAPFYGTAKPPAPPQFPGTCANLLGNVGRNSLYGPGLKTVDFSVFKNNRIPRISETFNLQFRAEFFNILNHTNFAAPNFLNDANNSIFDANGTRLGNAGVLARTTTSSRQIQLGMKIIF